MDIALLLARLLLAAVFAVAGLAKLTDRTGFQKTLLAFGLPNALTGPFGILLPVAELVVAAALITRSTAWGGALGAFSLLTLFIAAIATSLALGRKPDCRCFGQLHSAPVGATTLVRNALLALAASVLVWRGPAAIGPDLTASLGALTGVQLWYGAGGAIVLLLFVVEGRILFGLVRQNGRILMRLEAMEAKLGRDSAAKAEGLPVGARAPAFDLPGVDGDTQTLDHLLAAGKTLLLFTDPQCGPCDALLPEVGRWQREHVANLAIAIISRGSPEANRSVAVEHHLRQVLLQRDYEVADAYRAVGTPSAVVVQPDGTIGSRVAAGATEIRGLVARAAQGLPPVPSPDSTFSEPTNDGRDNGAKVEPGVQDLLKMEGLAPERQ